MRLFINITPHCRDVLNELLAVDGHVVKDKFINAYVEVINSHQLLRYPSVRSICSKSPKWWQNQYEGEGLILR